MRFGGKRTTVVRRWQKNWETTRRSSDIATYKLVEEFIALKSSCARANVPSIMRCLGNVTLGVVVVGVLRFYSMPIICVVFI